MHKVKKIGIGIFLDYRFASIVVHANLLEVARGLAVTPSLVTTRYSWRKQSEHESES